MCWRLFIRCSRLVGGALDPGIWVGGWLAADLRRRGGGKEEGKGTYDAFC